MDIRRINQLRQMIQNRQAGDDVDTGIMPYFEKETSSKEVSDASKEQVVKPLSEKSETINTANKVNTYVLACIVGGLHCSNYELWQTESNKILRALHSDKNMINFEELSWYFAEKFPDLCKVADQINFDSHNNNKSIGQQRVVAINAASKFNMPMALDIADDADFKEKSFNRHKKFLDFVDNKDPKKMSLAELVEITGSMDYEALSAMDKKKHNEFVNVGYGKMVDFVHGEEILPREKNGEACLYFKQVLKEIGADNEMLHGMMRNYIFPQLDNIRDGKEPKHIGQVINCMSQLSEKRDHFNQKYRHEVEQKKQKDELLSLKMENSVYKDKSGKYHKTSEYYEALYSKIVNKHIETMEKHDNGIKSATPLRNKVVKVLKLVEQQRNLVSMNEKNILNDSAVRL